MRWLLFASLLTACAQTEALSSCGADQAVCACMQRALSADDYAAYAEINRIFSAPGQTDQQKQAAADAFNRARFGDADSVAAFMQRVGAGGQGCGL